MRVDLDSDLGEGFCPWEIGDDAQMLSAVTSANVACGGHAGDPDTVFRTLALPRDKGVSIGAHPSYADPIGFGRRVIPMPVDEIARMCAAQIGALQGVAAFVGVPVAYVKPHDALTNLTARDRGVDDAIVGAVQKIDRNTAVLTVSGSEVEQAADKAGVPVYSEGFADRGDLSSGRLVPRNRPDAMIHDVQQVESRLLSFLETDKMPVVDGDPIKLAAHSVCVHGDSARAAEMACEIRNRLTAEGVQIASFLDT